MTEEIIIDGVDVAGCKFLEEAVRYNNNAVCSCTDVRDCEGDLFIECCGEKPSCYYKQLQRLEQLKNKYYQQTLDDEITISDLIEEIQGLKADRTLERISKLSIENARLEQENKELKEMLSKEPKAMQAFQTAYSGLKKDNEVLWGMVKDYKSALEEIRDINKLFFERKYGYPEDLIEIDNIINEVLQ